MDDNIRYLVRNCGGTVGLQSTVLEKVSIGMKVDLTEEKYMGHKSALEIYGLSYSQWEELIDEWIFSERDRRILKRKLLDDITYETLAGEFMMSEQQLKTIVKAAKPTLFKHI